VNNANRAVMIPDEPISHTLNSSRQDVTSGSSSPVVDGEMLGDRQGRDCLLAGEQATRVGC
jgi:hypothetical protein